MSDRDDLVEELREAASPRVFVTGTRLCDEGKVELARSGADEVELRVWAPGRPQPPKVTLYPEDLEWDCDCPSREDACDHAVAAAQFWARAASESVARPRLRYHALVRRDQLTLERSWVDPDGTTREVEGAIATRAVRGGFAPTDEDLAIDKLVTVCDGQAPGVETLPALFGWLARCEVEFEGETTTFMADPVRPCAVLRQEGSGFVLELTRDSRVEAVLADGVVRTNEGLAAVTHVSWSGARLERLPATRRYEDAAVGVLLDEVMPQLRAMGLEVTGDLPRTVRDLPVVAEVRVRANGPTLEATGRLVYGDPAVARIEHDRIVPLGTGWPERDAAAERSARRGLMSAAGLELDVAARVTGEAAMDLALRLRRSGVLLDDSSRAALKRFSGRLVARVRSGDARGERGWSVTFERADDPEQSFDATEVLQAWEQGESVFGHGAGALAMPAPFLEAHADALASFMSARAVDGSVAGHGRPAVLELLEATGVEVPPSLAGLRSLLTGDPPRRPRPKDLAAELRPYQEVGVDWLDLLAEAELGAMLCDDMGLGKTLQALTGLRTPALVVCPTSVLPNWAREAERFRPGLKVSVFHGPRREMDEHADVVLTTYGVLRSDTDLLAGRRWATAVLDEAQTIKNPDSQVARAALRLDARFRMTLSGTPVENRLEELWSQAQFTNPGLLGSRSEFAERWARPIAAGDEGRAAALRKRVRPFLLRRTKVEVAPELPARTEVTIHCELSESERTLYDALLATSRHEVARLLKDGGSVLSALERLLRLRQAACHPALVPGHERPHDDGGSAKLRHLMDELSALVPAGHRALVFSQWTSLLDLVEPHLQAGGFDFVRLDGSTRDRGAVVDAFSADEGPPVMLLSLKAGGTGLNLTAADHVYFLDPWWNPAAERQAADRAHRIGQTRPVTIRRLVAKDTVDERILALQERKRGLAEAVVATGGGLTRDELLSLLE